MFDIFKENEPEKKYSKQTVAVHLYIFLAQGRKCYANYNHVTESLFLHTLYVMYY